MQDSSDTTQPAQKKQKTSSNFSIGKLKNKTQLASLVKVNKDKTNGQKPALKADVTTDAASAAKNVNLQDSRSHDKSDAGTSCLGQKASSKAVEKTDAASVEVKVNLVDSSEETDKSEGTSAGTSGLGSLGILGDYSSSEDSDH